ncbi:hypothetical protein V6N12_034974 [Hibiscus sabdariffa]|uniref:Uncharacterized protein n=1 Tax=Hibiscus sabdariffa TaxID=183260 RepID=A0ABR2BPK1_9ROSI
MLTSTVNKSIVNRVDSAGLTRARLTRIDLVNGLTGLGSLANTLGPGPLFNLSGLVNRFRTEPARFERMDRFRAGSTGADYTSRWLESEEISGAMKWVPPESSKGPPGQTTARFYEWPTGLGSRDVDGSGGGGSAQTVNGR